ncbi:MAG: TonB-dependent receptor [Acidobacteria bacterium]|nr:TonB-dependent receptor [Acidobacteriota bacterium]
MPRTRGLVVSTIIRALSGTPFTIFDSTIDANQNGINLDPLPAGTFTNSRTFANGETLNFSVENKGGINGARLPGFFSIDLRLAYKFNFTERVNAGFTFEVFNLANRTNYDETTIPGNTSQIALIRGVPQRTLLIPSVAKPPRTLQLGFRVAF